ncbi:ribokinase [bacterium C-53]|nr:ribokinase [Lachnospiraceae bacterium]NBI03406.1 ribokinase [Lachnospiraceae bacterium]RKJ09724.1 ribokinase [bacterium C-53]
MKVLNFGSLNYDYVYKVDHMILAGETMDSYGLETHFGGKGLNQSMALAKAGVPVYHAGMVGEDGQAFLDLCRENGVDTKYIRMVSGKSGHTIIQLDKNAQNSILLYGGSNRMITKEYIDEVLGDFGRGDIILLQNEVNLMPYIIDAAYEKGMQIILNPSPYNEALDECDFGKVSVFLVNEIEGGQISGESDPDRILDVMMEKYPDAKVVLTLGGEGVAYRDKNQTCRQGIFKVKAVDTTAAGDTFTGYFIAGMLEELPVQERLKRCAKASAMAVSKMGAAQSIPTKEEVESAVLDET